METVHRSVRILSLVIGVTVERASCYTVITFPALVG